MRRRRTVGVASSRRRPRARRSRRRRRRQVEVALGDRRRRVRKTIRPARSSRGQSRRRRSNGCCRAASCARSRALARRGRSRPPGRRPGPRSGTDDGDSENAEDVVAVRREPGSRLVVVDERARAGDRPRRRWISAGKTSSIAARSGSSRSTHSATRRGVLRLRSASFSARTRPPSGGLPARRGNARRRARPCSPSRPR